MFKSTALRMVERMVNEGHDLTWLSEQSNKPGQNFELPDLVSGLRESVDTECPHEIQKAMLDLVEPIVREVMDRFSAQSRAGVQKTLGHALTVIGLSSRAGEYRATCLIQAAQLYLVLAEDGDDEAEGLYEQAALLYSGALVDGFNPGEQKWCYALAGAGSSHLGLAKLSLDTEKNLRKAIRYFIRAREEGVPKWTSLWVEMLARQAQAHLRLSELDEDVAENQEMAAFLSMRSAKEGSVSQPGS